VENMAAVMSSPLFLGLESDHPSLWKETRASLGLPADEDEEEKEEEEEDEPQAKRARKG